MLNGRPQGMRGWLRELFRFSGRLSRHAFWTRLAILMLAAGLLVDLPAVLLSSSGPDATPAAAPLLAFGIGNVVMQIMTAALVLRRGRDSGVGLLALLCWLIAPSILRPLWLYSTFRGMSVDGVGSLDLSLGSPVLSMVSSNLLLSHRELGLALFRIADDVGVATIAILIVVLLLPSRTERQRLGHEPHKAAP